MSKDAKALESLREFVKSKDVLSEEHLAEIFNNPDFETVESARQHLTNEKLLNFMVGQVMQKNKNVDPKKVRELFRKRLENEN